MMKSFGKFAICTSTICTCYGNPIIQGQSEFELALHAANSLNYSEAKIRFLQIAESNETTREGFESITYLLLISCLTGDKQLAHRCEDLFLAPNASREYREPNLLYSFAQFLSNPQFDMSNAEIQQMTKTDWGTLHFLREKIVAPANREQRKSQMMVAVAMNISNCEEFRLKVLERAVTLSPDFLPLRIWVGVTMHSAKKYALGEQILRPVKNSNGSETFKMWLRHFYDECNRLKNRG